MPKLPDSERRRLVDGILSRGGTKDDVFAALSKLEGSEATESTPAPTPMSFGKQPPGEAPIIRTLPARVPSPIATTQQLQDEATQRAEARQNITLPISAMGLLTANPVGLAATQAASEGVDKLTSMVQGHPEEGPSLMGAGARTALAGGVPLAFNTAAKVLRPAAQITKEVMQDTIAQPLGKMLSTLWKAPAEGAELSAGKKIVKTIKTQVGRLHPLTPTRDAIIKQAESAGGALPAKAVGELVDTLRTSYPGKITKKYLAAKTELNSIADKVEKESAGQAMPLTRLHEIVQQFQERGFAEAGSSQVSRTLSQVQRPLKEHVVSEIKRTLGPATANTFSEMQSAIGTRAGAIKAARSIIKVPQGQESTTANKAAGTIIKTLDPNSKISTIFRDFEDATGLPLYTQAKELALKRAWNPSDVQKATWMSIITTRVLGSAAGATIGGEEHRGSGAIIGLLASDPRLARPLVKFLLTSGQTVPRTIPLAIEATKQENP